MPTSIASVLGSGTAWDTRNEPLIVAGDIIGAVSPVGSGLDVIVWNKSKVPVAPLNLPSPPVILIVPEPLSSEAVPLLVPNSLSFP
jgi:hypothetical protein